MLAAPVLSRDRCRGVVVSGGEVEVESEKLYLYSACHGNMVLPAWSGCCV